MKKFELHNSIPWILAVSTVLMVFGELLGIVILPQPGAERPYMHTFMAYASFITMWGAVVFAVTVFKKNRYIKASFRMNHAGNTFEYLGIGFLLGFFLNTFCACAAFFHGDIRLELQRFELLPVLGLFTAVFIQSSAEEALCRGFLYQRLLKSTAYPTAAIVLNSAFFAALHLLNEGVTPLAFYDLLITGVFFSLLVFYFDSLWMAMGLHATWNFTQSIILGLPNSGSTFPYSIFQLDGSLAHNSFAYHVEFGLEGTWLSSVLITLCCVFLYVWKNNQKSIWQKIIK